jgi:hypothetical protein
LAFSLVFLHFLSISFSFTDINGGDTVAAFVPLGQLPTPTTGSQNPTFEGKCARLIGKKMKWILVQICTRILI